MREQAKPEDTFVSLHTYPFDLALYARVPRPTWVVDDWLNPEVPTRDNWRKELYDAAQFDPATGQEVLVSPAEFNARLCKAPDGARYWVWGTTADNPVYLPLRGLSPVVTSARYAMWRVEVDAAPQAAGLWRNAQSRLAMKVATASPASIRASRMS